MALTDDEKDIIDSSYVGSYVDRIQFSNFQQIAGYLMVLLWISHPDFRKLLASVDTFDEIDGMQRFIDEHHCGENVKLTLDVLSQNSYLYQPYRWYTLGNRQEVYQYMLEKIMAKIAAMMAENQALMEDESLVEHAYLYDLLLYSNNDEDSIKNQISLYTKIDPNAKFGHRHKESKGHEAFYLEHRDQLKTLISSLNGNNSTMQIIALYNSINDFLNSGEDYAGFIELMTHSDFLNYGKATYVSPEFIGNLAGSIAGLFTALLLGSILAQFAPSMLLAPELARTIFVTAASLLVLVFGPLYIQSVVKDLVKDFNRSYQHHYEEKMRGDIPKYDMLLSHMGIFRKSQASQFDEGEHLTLDIPMECF